MRADELAKATRKIRTPDSMFSPSRSDEPVVRLRLLFPERSARTPTSAILLWCHDGGNEAFEPHREAGCYVQSK
jgi:hypothetical protein